MATNTVSPRRLEAAMSAAMQLRATLPDDDDRLLTDTLDGETEALDLLDKLAEQAIADKLLAEKASERAKRLIERANRRRDIIERMMLALELTRLERALFTASISYHRELADNLDTSALPEAFFRHAPDRVAIAKALRSGLEVPGASLDNEQPRLTLRVT